MVWREIPDDASFLSILFVRRQSDVPIEGWADSNSWWDVTGCIGYTDENFRQLGVSTKSDKLSTDNYEL